MAVIEARQAWLRLFYQPVPRPEARRLLTRTLVHKSSKEQEFWSRRLCVQIPAQSFSSYVKPKLTTQPLHSQLKWENSHHLRGRATLLPYTQTTRKVIVYMNGEISGLSPEHSDHTEPAQGLWGLEPLFLKHFTQPLACSESPGKASVFFF